MVVYSLSESVVECWHYSFMQQKGCQKIGRCERTPEFKMVVVAVYIFEVVVVVTEEETNEKESMF